jgi:hypothetical protein
MNQPTMQLWSEIVGAFVLNFGAAEMSIHVWIRMLTNDQAKRDEALDMKLGQRISLVKKLITDSNLSSDIKTQSFELWEEVLRLSITRSKIADSPLAKPNNNTDGWGILDVKKMKGIGPFKIIPLEFLDIARDGKQLAKILSHLLEPSF